MNVAFPIVLLTPKVTGLGLANNKRSFLNHNWRNHP